ncbi:MAG: tetratricopeptide repeat protein [Pseudomonadota bacterium]
MQRAIALRGEGRIEDAEAVLKDALARFPLDAAHRGGVCCDGGPSGGLD